MTAPLRAVRRLWWLLPLALALLVVSADQVRVRRLAMLAAQPEWSVDPAAAAALNPAAGAEVSRLLPPDASGDTYEWMLQVERSHREHTWRIHTVDYDNAPSGRATRMSDLYRAWIAAVAAGFRLVDGRSFARSLDAAVCWAGPLLHLMLLLAATAVVWLRFGRLPAVLVAVAIAAWYPLAPAFLPGVLDQTRLALLFDALSVLLLAAAQVALASPAVSLARVRLDFVAAGLAGGLALAVDRSAALLTLTGLVAGAIVAAWLQRAKPVTPRPPWRLWALAGGVCSLLVTVAGSFPDHLNQTSSWVTAGWGLVWIAVGEALERITPHPPTSARRSRRREWIIALAFAGIAIAASFGLGRMSGAQGPTDPRQLQLTALNGGLAAPNVIQWLIRDGLSLEALATLASLGVAVLALATLLFRTAAPERRGAFLIVLGPVLVVGGAALVHLRLWATAEVLLLGVIAVSTGRRPADSAPTRGVPRWVWGGLIALAAVLGWTRWRPAPTAASDAELSRTEMQSIILRDLSHWLAVRAGRPAAVVLAPPDLTLPLCFHGGLRGVGSLAPENDAGRNATLRIAASLSPREAATLLGQHEVAFIVVPSWDHMLEDLAETGTATPRSSLMALLDHWELPNWLRPVPYLLPRIAGMEDEHVAVFQLADGTDDETAWSRLAEYYLDTGRLPDARAARDRLQRYRAQLSALVTIAEVDFATGDTAAFERSFRLMAAALKAGADRTLPWERRVSLAITLTAGQRIDLAVEQARRCLDEATPAGLRSLNANTIYRFLRLCHAARLEPPAEIRRSAVELLPPALARQLPAATD